MTAERPPKREHGVRQTRKGTEIVSRYETLRAELGRLRIRQAIAVFAPAAATALLLIPATQPGGARLLVALGGLTVLPLVLHRVWRFTFPTYRAWSDRSSHIRAEIADLQERIAAVFNKYRERQKGERFKQAYDLMGRSVRDLEEALSIGMFRERREIFVTAFMRGGVAVRVTASHWIALPLLGSGQPRQMEGTRPKVRLRRDPAVPQPPGPRWQHTTVPAQRQKRPGLSRRSWARTVQGCAR